ncbi:MAG: hypothetical protein LCH61_05540 [Proteobacteria bacterium]|nr:hypothetical protein [Pseudomonadota bacterium]
MARHLETLLRDIDNGRAERPQGIILLLDTGNDPAIPLGLILRHPYFRLRFSPVRSVATRHDATAPDLADLVIDVEETGPDELLAALSAPVSRPPALRERLYRTAMIPPARR